MIQDIDEINVVLSDTGSIDVSIDNDNSISVNEGTPTDIAQIMHNEQIRQENETQRIANEEQRIENETARENYITDLKQRVLDGEFNGEDGYSPTATVVKENTTATITITDKNGTTTAQISDGQNGTDGEDGFSPIANVTKSGDTATITITDKTGTTTATVSDGTDGVDGTDGQDGYSPTATVSKSGKVATITITDKNGTTTTEIRDGEDGQGSGDMLKSTYDTDNNGIVDNAEKVNNHTVLTDVPADAAFTDFVPYYTYLNKGERNNPVMLNELEPGTYFVHPGGTSCSFRLTNELTVYSYDTGASFILTIPKEITVSSLTDGEVLAIIKTFYYENSFKASEHYVYLKYNENNSNHHLKTEIESIDINNVVDTINNQTVAGKKTFSILPESSVTPTTNDQLTNKSYVDSGLSGKQATIDSSHKLDADLVDDTTSTNKFVTASDKTAWNNKSDFIPKYTYMQKGSSSDPIILDELDAGTYFVVVAGGGDCSFALTSGYTKLSYNTGASFILTIPKEITVSSLTDGEVLAIIKTFKDSSNVCEKYIYLKYKEESAGNRLSTSTNTITINNAVDTINNQTIDGVKTFSSLPESSATPTTNNQLTNKSYVDSGLSGKQDTLVSGTNIKTINNTSLLGSGDITISGGTAMTILSYGNSTWNDFITAYNSNSIVYARASTDSDPSVGDQTRLAFMAYVDNETTPTSVEFQYYRSRPNHSASQQGDHVVVYTLTSTNGGTWSVASRETAVNVDVSGGLTRSYSSDTLTIDASDKVSKTGDTMSGNLSITGDMSSTSFEGKTWDFNTENTSDTWIPVASSNGKWQHRTIPVTAYSTSEINTYTKWIDGKWIYRKVFSKTSISDFSTGVTNVSTMVNMRCMLKQTSTGDWRTLPWLYVDNNNYGGASWGGGFFYKKSNGYICFQMGSDLKTISQAYIIIEYTKS